MEQKLLKTREEVLADFATKGISVRSWAIANGITPSVVHGVLNGRLTGRIGEAHKAAVKLGLKHGEVVYLDNGREYLKTEISGASDAARVRHAVNSHG